MRRRIADGIVRRRQENCPNGRAMVEFDSILPHIAFPLDGDDLALILRADGGDPEAQTDLGLKFLFNQNPRGALYWLELAVKQDYAAAMYYFGRCHTDGVGVQRNENEGLIWILKAALLGHAIAEAQMQNARERLAGAI
jgi:TPR repeat protein